MHQVENLLNLAIYIRLRQLAHHKSESHVLSNRHMGEERIVLENDADAPLVYGNAVQVTTIQNDIAHGRNNETRNHLQRRGLSASGRTEKRKEFSFPDLQIYRTHHDGHSP